MAGKRPRYSRDTRRRVYGQNFLASRALAAQLVRDGQLDPDLLVVEVGAGAGILTAELARIARRVQAVEIDSAWAARLRRRFSNSANVDVVDRDWFRLPLPGEPFCVVANVPFNATTRLLHRLLDDPNVPLVRADLVVQWEVARKRAGAPRTAASASWSPWWQFRLGRRLPRSAFRPQPAVDAGVLIVERRAEPLLPAAMSEQFSAFAHALFTGTVAHDLSPSQWTGLFTAYSKA